MSFRYTRVILLAACAVLLGATTGYSQARGAGAKPAAAATRELLALCGRCPSPTVTTKTGIGTANARAEARMTKAAVVERDGPCDGDATSACSVRPRRSTGRRPTARPDVSRRSWNRAIRSLASGTTATSAAARRSGRTRTARSSVATMPATASRSPSSGRCSAPVL